MSAPDPGGFDRRYDGNRMDAPLIPKVLATLLIAFVLYTLYLVLGGTP